MIEQMMLRNDVENSRARHLFLMIETHAVHHPGAAIVAGDIKAVMAQRFHHLDLILRHGAERIAGMIVTARRLFGIAVTAKIGGDHGEFFRQPRREFLP